MSAQPTYHNSAEAPVFARFADLLVKVPAALRASPSAKLVKDLGPALDRRVESVLSSFGPDLFRDAKAARAGEFLTDPESEKAAVAEGVTFLAKSAAGDDETAALALARMIRLVEIEQGPLMARLKAEAGGKA